MSRQRKPQQEEEDGPRINQNIRAPRVLVIDENGTKLGEFAKRDAIELALERELDLIEVAPNARPPVCRLGDHSKLIYERQKRERKQRRNQVTVTVKEIKLTPKISEHDFQVKVKHCRRFLSSQDKVKVTIRFRGREMSHREIGEQRCIELFEAVKDLAEVEVSPRMDGRTMAMLLAPLKNQAPNMGKGKSQTDDDSSSYSD